MAVRKLTADFARRAMVEGAAERTVYWDEKQPGFGLMVTERGHRSWVVQYRAHHRSRRLTLDFVLRLDDARREAKKILGEVARGGDPVVERRKAADAQRHALRAIVDEYFVREGKKLRSAEANSTPANGPSPVIATRASQTPRWRCLQRPSRCWPSCRTSRVAISCSRATAGSP